jgi:hypothetical protein
MAQNPQRNQFRSSGNRGMGIGRRMAVGCYERAGKTLASKKISESQRTQDRLFNLALLDQQKINEKIDKRRMILQR